MKLNAMKTLFLTLSILFSALGISQEITQNIRGTVTDSETQFPLVGAKVKIMDAEGKVLHGAVCDAGGKFTLYNVPVGKHPVTITFVGYADQTITILNNSGKETIMTVFLQESGITAKEVVVTGRKKGEVINEMATVSAQSFSVEETNRYAGSRSDPARMMSNYAGCQGTDDSRNDIVVRGNSPLGIQYRIEGLQIPNPNHFGISGSSGGPVSILNNKFLDNSDFFMSAFPAEYGNSTAGVFDLRVRQGNDNIHEFTGQFGFLGTEALFEGPLSKKKGSSYLVMGRYSTLSLMDAIGISYGTDAVPSYGDFAYKLNFPTEKGGQWSLWGMGGTSKIDILISDQEVPAQDAFGQQDRDQHFGSSMIVNGVTYKKPVNKKTLVKFSLGHSYQQQTSHHEYVNRSLSADSASWIYADPKTHNLMAYNFQTHTMSGYASANYKPSSKHVIKYGVNVDAYMMYMHDSIRYDIKNADTGYFQRWDYDSDAPEFMIQPFLQWKYKASQKLTLNAGLHMQYFTLGNAVSWAEPRLGLKYTINDKSNIALGGGMHSQAHPRYIYLYHQYDSGGNKVYHNKNLGFTRAIHSVLSYTTVVKKTMFKAEVYYQYLYQVPVEVQPSSFSILNQGSGFSRFFPDSLQNTGTGQNYGLELTVQKFFNNNFFFLLTGSVFESTYVGSDNIERNTDFNGNFIVNGLAGYEVKVGKKKNSKIGFGAKVTYAGGKRYGYVDYAESAIQTDIIYKDSLYNERQFDNYFRLDFKLSWALNAKKTTHEIGIDLVNVLNTKNILGLTYAPEEPNGVAERYQLGFLPIFYYKLDFKVAGKKDEGPKDL